MIPKFDIYKDKWAVTSDDVIKPGLTAIAEALTLIGSPEKKLQIVHLAGTNGKGSTLTFLEAILMEHGLRVGKFMSPCILDVHDQIQVAKQPISAEEMDRVFQQMQAAGLSGKLTDFELLTVAAFLHFVNSNVDVAIIEAGMGGLLDSTNVVTPIVSIIPSIALEHTKYLGNTIESIAHHKAGIIKQHQPVIIGELPLEARAVIYKEARYKQATVLELDDQFYIEHTKNGGCYTNEENGLRIANLLRKMKGPHQANNMALAITAFFEVAIALHVPVSIEGIQHGINKATILGRFEEILPYIILDGAHNPASAETLVATIRQEFPEERITFVIGILADKDVQNVFNQLEQVSDCFYFVDFNNPRAMSAKDMVELSGASQKEVLRDYVQFLQTQSENKCRTVVTGSLYLLTDVRNKLIGNN
ncbi:bifunctional folylpolyglutamate synthase/dihydrofolate synthase [Lysinibacillus parviboronicapiens]|uniref:bifunctional folylpolyglutamate synthase/dihydrofolate synthase n=1 Tax=Lysinibacillus parviboronicapiens TaxID=436516 RepID=UPI000D3B2F07|nr:folylpolyglutamate synthase/dihydrofolate synthase family protein [Lysinibacillus parviboronicapiens]